MLQSHLDFAIGGERARNDSRGTILALTHDHQFRVGGGGLDGLRSGGNGGVRGELTEFVGAGGELGRRRRVRRVGFGGGGGVVGELRLGLVGHWELGFHFGDGGGGDGGGRGGGGRGGRGRRFRGVHHSFMRKERG
uniref:Uncharacterized protein n=1 Tax=Opuntia streptacantha TaxID=393608 RepID=A0A7C9EL82_OPUST